MPTSLLPHSCCMAWFLRTLHFLSSLKLPHLPSYSKNVFTFSDYGAHVSFVYISSELHFPCQLSELKTITSYIMCQSPAPAGQRNWRGDVGSAAITNTQETYLRRQNLILFSFIFLLILFYYLRQKSLCKKEITSQT